MTLHRALKALAAPLLLLFAFQVSFGQNRTVSGRITDVRDGSPVVGASVTAKGTNVGTATGADGTFSLSVPTSTTTLVVSAVGFATQELAASDNMAISLSGSGNNLNEVVVTGYGTARKRDLTGAVASVKAKDFNKGVFTAPDQLIQGKVAGVQVLNNSGAPGGATTVRIRGNASLRSGNQPLFVVDGIPLDGGSARPGLSNNVGSSPGGNPLNFLNPNDIQSMDVLKDASAAAIYGSRASNGVVLITTKKGATGAPRLDVSTSFGVSNIMKRLDVLDGNEYRQALKDYGLTQGDYGQNVDALDEILRTAFTQNYNISVNGGNENGRYRFSAGYLNQEGIIKESDFKKYTGNFSGAYKFLNSKRLGLDFNLIVAHTTENIAPISNDAGFQNSLIGQALQWNPTHPLRKPNDSIFIITPIGNSTINPLAMLAATQDRADVTEVLGSVSPYFKILDNLEYRLLYSIRHGVGVRRSEIAQWLNWQGIEGRGRADYAENEQTTQQLTQTLTYNTRLGKDLNLTALLGYEYMRFEYLGTGLSAQDFVDVGLNYTNILQYSTINSRNIYSVAPPISELQSFFGRATLNWADRLIVTATLRSDGSSKFGENNRYGVFPSFAAAWNLGNESFIRDNQTFVGNLKLRAGYGVTGNQEFPAGASLDRFQFDGPGSARQINFGNPDLKWESSTMLNFGLDFSVWKDRAWGSIDYFIKTTTDILFEADVAQPGPANTKVWKNLPGEVKNSGLEIALMFAAVRNDNLVWNIGGNISFLTNKLTNFQGAYETGALNGQGISGTRAQRLVNNQPLNVFYLRRFLGIDKGTGQSLYENDGNTLFFDGNPNPKTLYGFTTDLTWKKLSAVINMNGAGGHVIYNNTANTTLPIGNLGTRNIAKSLIGTGVKEDLSNPIVASSRYLEDGSYLKLANASVSYRIGDLGTAFKNITVSLTGQNLFVITKFSGFDPEVNTDKAVGGIPSFGIEYQPYPTARTILLGLNFTL